MEEEFQIVDAETRELSQSVERILPAAQASLGDQMSSELRPSMIETETFSITDERAPGIAAQRALR